MSSAKLTQKEAETLLRMTKRSIEEKIEFPQKGRREEFHVVGDNKSDLFVISLYRSNYHPTKYEICARIKKNGTMLLELHINPTNVHPNPDGTKIFGSHWHVYTEGYGTTFAFPATDIHDEAFVENTINFFIKFNIIERPLIVYQAEIK